MGLRDSGIVWILTGARGVELNPFGRSFLGKAQGQSRTGCVMKMSDDNSFISTGSELGPHTLPGTAIWVLVCCCTYFSSWPFLPASRDSETVSCTASFPFRRALWAHPQIPPVVSEFHPNEEINICFIFWSSQLCGWAIFGLWTPRRPFFIGVLCPISHAGWFLGVGVLGCTRSWLHLRGASCLGHHSFSRISVIVKAPWNTNIFNRMVFLLEKKTVAHPQQVCDRERYWNHLAFMDWVSEEKSLLLSAVL